MSCSASSRVPCSSGALQRSVRMFRLNSTLPGPMIATFAMAPECASAPGPPSNRNGHRPARSADRRSAASIASGSMATFLLAFDHRRSLMTSFFEAGDDPDRSQVATAREIKTVIADGLLAAIRRQRVDRRDAGGLVDATYGGIAIDRLRTSGVRFAVPVEASGKRELEFEHPDWRQRLEAIKPTWAKVLVRYNPSGDAAMNERQRGRLLKLQTAAREIRLAFLLELLVPPEPAQRADDYDTATRPRLVIDAIDELRRAGIEPDLWKIEGSNSGRTAGRLRSTPARRASCWGAA